MVEHRTTLRKEDNEAYRVETGVPLKRISWSAVFSGVIVSMVIYLLLAILGTAIGTSTIDPLDEQNPLEGVGIGAAIWTGLSMLIAVAAGGYVTGRLAQREGALHGFLMFGVNTIVCTWFLLVVANSAVMGTMNILGAGLQTVGSGIKAVAPPVTEMTKEKLEESGFNLNNIQSELETTLRQTGKPELQPEAVQENVQNEMNNAQNQAAQNPNANDDALANFFKGLTDRNEEMFQAADREALKNIIKSRTGKTDAEAEQIVAQTEKNYQEARAKYEQLKQQAEQKSRELAEKAAAATAKAAWFTFFMLIVEAVLASVMGMIGRRTQPAIRTTSQRR